MRKWKLKDEEERSGNSSWFCLLCPIRFECVLFVAAVALHCAVNLSSESGSIERTLTLTNGPSAANSNKLSSHCCWLFAVVRFKSDFMESRAIIVESGVPIIYQFEWMRATKKKKKCEAAEKLVLYCENLSDKKTGDSKQPVEMMEKKVNVTLLWYWKWKEHWVRVEVKQTWKNWALINFSIVVLLAFNDF